MKAQTEINEILADLRTAYGPPKFSWQDADNHIAAAEAEASAKLQRLINSVIGEDEEPLDKSTAMHLWQEARNQLRAKQRQALSHIQEPK